MKTAIVKTAKLTSLVSALALASAAYADTAPAGPPAPTFPSLSGPLTANATPISFNAGQLGTIFVGGVASAIAAGQTNVVSPDTNEKGQADISNAQVFINKTDGLIQFSAQVGSYSIPDLGVPYVRSSVTTNNTFGTFDQGFVKLAPSGPFSLEVGKLPTLIGNEYTFSYENMNIQRGLLWGQESAVSRGVQGNFSQGPVNISVAWTDGFYSGKYNWASLLASYAATSSDTLAIAAGGNTDRKTNVATSATNVFQNNSQIYNLIYTHTSGNWTFSPYLQYTDVPALAFEGTKSTTTSGAALLASYKINDNWSFPARVEYIEQSGSAGDNSAPLLYGPGSKAWSLTLTPTYQYKQFFVRAEGAVVSVSDGADGSKFGKSGNQSTQFSGALETGVMF